MWPHDRPHCAHLDDLGEGGHVLVVGGNPTSIEEATEIAESRPGLGVPVVTAENRADMAELPGRRQFSCSRHARAW